MFSTRKIVFVIFITRLTIKSESVAVRFNDFKQVEDETMTFRYSFYKKNTLLLEKNILIDILYISDHMKYTRVAFKVRIYSISI